jgi:hypothetical protein
MVVMMLVMIMKKKKGFCIVDRGGTCVMLEWNSLKSHTLVIGSAFISGLPILLGLGAIASSAFVMFTKWLQMAASMQPQQIKKKNRKRQWGVKGFEICAESKAQERRNHNVWIDGSMIRSLE